MLPSAPTNEALLPDVPPPLDELIRSLYTDPILARRALLAPWPVDFRSVYDERALWRATPVLDDFSAQADAAKVSIPILSDPFFRGSADNVASSRSDPTPDPRHVRRRSFERVLRQEQQPFQSTDQPYFLSEGTLGTLRSPYAEMSNQEYWLYVTLYGSEDAARRWLEGFLVPGLGHKTTLDFLRNAHHPSLWTRLRHTLAPPSHDPHAIAWSAQPEILYPVYT